MRPGVLRRVLRWPVRIVLWLVVGAVVWVLAYRVIDPPGGIYLAREWIRLGGVARDWRDLDGISPYLARSVVAAEDARFCAHWGIDVEAVADAVEANANGRRLRGGSTITQQVAKNVFLWHGRSWVRKGLEAGFALLIETTWPKWRILEVYLNVVEFDAGVFGAEAAAQHYFKRPADKLTETQAARLAAVLPDPKRRDPTRATSYMARRGASIVSGARTMEAEGRDRCFMVN